MDATLFSLVNLEELGAIFGQRDVTKPNNLHKYCVILTYNFAFARQPII